MKHRAASLRQQNNLSTFITDIFDTMAAQHSTYGISLEKKILTNNSHTNYIKKSQQKVIIGLLLLHPCNQTHTAPLISVVTRT